MRIYLSYRPEDSADFSDRVTDHLLRRYGPGSVVRNVVGRDVADYERQVSAWLQQCNVVLVVIGPGWLDGRDAHGNRLLDNPLDPVRIQVRTAIQLNRLIVPLLVNGARVPAAGLLPPDVAALVSRQAYTVRGDPDFNDDMFGVYRQINTQLEWRPASLTAIVSAGGAVVGLAGILFAANVFGGIAIALMFSLLMLVGIMVALATCFAVSARRRHWIWLAAFVGVALASIVILALPDNGKVDALIQYGVWMAGMVLVGVFGFIGPRRERAFTV